MSTALGNISVFRCLRNEGSSLRSVVTGEYFELAAQCCTVKYVHESLHGGHVRRAAAHYEVIAFAVQRDEIQSESLGSGARRETDIGFLCGDGISGRKVSIGDAIVSCDVVRGHAGSFNELVQQTAAAGAGFAIDESDCLSPKVFDFSNALRIFGLNDEAFFPTGECDHRKVLAGKFFAKERQIEFPGFRVFEV